MTVGPPPSGGSPPDAGPWWRPFASSGPVRVFHVDLAAHSRHEAAAWEWLAEDERRRGTRFHYAGPRRQFSLCRGALRAVLGQELGCENRDLAFGSERRGKPFALVGGKRAPIDFNISHSGVHGLIALSREGRVGADVEERRSRDSLPGLVGTVFSPREQGILAGLEGRRWLEAFLRFWTIKEALAKAWGTGLHTDFSGFQAPPEILDGRRTGVFACPRLSATAWRVEDLGNGELAAAVAYER